MTSLTCFLGHCGRLVEVARAQVNQDIARGTFQKFQNREFIRIFVRPKFRLVELPDKWDLTVK